MNILLFPPRSKFHYFQFYRQMDTKFEIRLLLADKITSSLASYHCKCNTETQAELTHVSQLKKEPIFIGAERAKLPLYSA